MIRFVLALVFASSLVGAVRAAPQAELWARWTAHDPASEITVDHGTWDRFLRTYVVPGIDGVNRVAYARVSAGDRAITEDYIDKLAAVR